MMKWLRRRLHEQDGITLAELLVSMAVMSIASVIFLTTLSSIQTAVSREALSTEINNQARLALQTIDRHIRSGNVLYTPPADGTSIIVYTQSNAPSFKTASYSGNRCVEWRVSSGTLQSRWWPSAHPSDWAGGVVGDRPSTPWRTVATGIVNYQAPTVVNAFKISADPYKGGRTVDVILLVNEKYTTNRSQTTRSVISVTGRNTSYSTLTGACEAPTS